MLFGHAVAIVEGEERRVGQWDFVHCPPETRHAFAGTGDGPCVLLCAGSRQFQKDGPWGLYCADETAARYNASRRRGQERSGGGASAGHSRSRRPHSCAR